MPYASKAKQLSYQATWRQKRRHSWLAKNGPCVDCGTWSDLEVDHVDAKSKISHRIWSWSMIRLNAELTKCVTRCRSCHVLKTRLMGEKATGSQNGSARLNEQQVTQIRQLHTEGTSYRALGKQFSVHYTTIQQICQHKIWK